MLHSALTNYCVELSGDGSVKTVKEVKGRISTCKGFVVLCPAEMGGGSAKKHGAGAGMRC